MTIIAQVTNNFRDYTWLINSVISWTHRSDITAQIPDFVLLAEERMSADLEARGANAVIVLPTVAGLQTVALPPGVIQIMTVGIPFNAPLDFITTDTFSARYVDIGADVPRDYTVIGDALYLGPTPDAVYQLQVTAHMSLPALADAADGANWLIKRNPALYLAATMVEACLWLRDTDGLSIWGDKYTVALNTANATRDTAGDLAVRTDTYNP